LWQAIAQDITSGAWPSALELAELFIESMTTTFDTVADDMPYQGPFDAFRRQKLIHTVGCIALAKYTPKGNTGYTGLFGGSNYAFVRFSTASQPGTTNPNTFIPAISFKFLRTYVPSANIMAMYSLEGSDSFNPFKHDLTNHVPNLSLNASESLHLLKAKFMSASAWPSMIGLYDFAQYDEKGNQASSPSFPFRLVFQPLKDLKTAFPDTYDGLLCNQLATLSPRPLFNVWAYRSPSAMPSIIGTLSLASPFAPSLYGDQTLFFQHALMEDDMALHSDWPAQATKILDKQGTLPYFNGDPDLPDQ